MTPRRALPIAIGLLTCAGVPAATRLPAPHAVVVWAWERPEDLGFLAAQHAEVAFLAATVRLHGIDADVRPRLQPLRVARGATLIPVVRVEADGARPAELTDRQRDAVVDAIVARVKPETATIQVDFDATRSQRTFYAAVLADVRRRLPASTRISITALASWCLGDAWLDGLPVDEAVPMLFRMGPDGPGIRAALVRDPEFASPLCAASVGVSSDEPRPALTRTRRVYWFHPRPWSEAAFAAVRREMEDVS